jgi:hypothetical protein
MISLTTLTFLTSARGIALLERLAHEDLTDQNTLSLITHLRKDFSADEAGAALELARLRVKAAGKFGANAEKMFFTREALEQASDPLIRDWRGRSIEVSGQTLTDMCCSIGSDALAFAEAKAHVTGIDNDPLRIEMARLNAAALGFTGDRLHFETGDAYEAIIESDALFYDPARREAGGGRIHDVERYQPPLSLLNNWRARLKIAKLSPAVEMRQIAPYLARGWCVNFVSVNGDLKEAELRLSDGLGIRAVLLIEQGAADWRKSERIEAAPLDKPRQWLIEPDPALIRAGLVDEAAWAWNGAKLDDTIAYITVETAPDSEWARAWHVLDWMPFNLKKLRHYLHERNIGTVTVKKRGTAVTPESLFAQLKLKGENSVTLVLTRLKGMQVVIICEDYPANKKP